jgi:hypothetical protein
VVVVDRKDDAELSGMVGGMNVRRQQAQRGVDEWLGCCAMQCEGIYWKFIELAGRLRTG